MNYELLLFERERILREVTKWFRDETAFVAEIGLELEFYVVTKDGGMLFDKNLFADYLDLLRVKLTKDPLISAVECEQGQGQIEIKTHYTTDLFAQAVSLENAKAGASAISKDLRPLFSAQPFAHDCSSALQFNITLTDSSKTNLFARGENLLSRSILALLDNTDWMMALLAPESADYLRFELETNLNLHRSGKYTAPVNLSFGGDNRTAAIRIPGHGNQRLEYRIPAAQCDPYLGTAAILIALGLGLKISEEKLADQIKKFGKIYGNAFAYPLPDFIKDHDVAQRKFYSESNPILKKMSRWIN